MTTVQAVFLGMMIALTPSVALLAFLLWREGTNETLALEFNDQPLYPDAQQPNPIAH